jgi:site-specific DNA-cytosine methylase
VEHLEQLGWFVKISVVAGSHFRCASSRLRLVLVAFRDRAAFARFTPPPPQAIGMKVAQRTKDSTKKH